MSLMVVSDNITGTKYTMAETNDLANDSQVRSKLIPREWRDVGAARPKQSIARPSWAVLITILRIEPLITLDELIREGDNPFGLCIPASIALRVLVVAPRCCSRRSNDEPVFVTVDRGAPVQRKAFSPER
jgi:hypothetical protein